MLPLPLADSFGGRSWEAKCGASEAVRTSWAGARHAYARSCASGGSNFLLGPVCHAALAAAGITNGAPFRSDSVPLGERSAFIRGQYMYTGSRTSFVNVLPPAGRPLSAYSLVDLRVGLNQGPWEIALFARNLFDAHAEIADRSAALVHRDPPNDRIFSAPCILIA
jgi:hypothetical protein